jgi:DNA-binding SARP family transcriptional activator
MAHENPGRGCRRIQDELPGPAPPSPSALTKTVGAGTAALAVRAGDVVPVDMLAEAAWDRAPPASWHTTIRNYIKRLRRVLEHEAGSRILTRPPGYLLQADRDEVDVLLITWCRRRASSW